MRTDMTDDLDRRLRAARPREARADEYGVDAELLARVREEPIAPRRGVRRAVAVPVAAGVTLAATAVVMLGGGPGDVGGPSSAAAITQTLRWLDPPAGTILHVRSVETQGTQTTTRELWRSADNPAAARQVTQGAHTVETAGDAFYDPATNTIYDPRRARMLPRSRRRGSGRSRRPARVRHPAIRRSRPATRSSRRCGSCCRSAGWRSPDARTTTAPRRGRSRSSPRPAGRPGRCGCRPTTASRSSCAIPVATPSEQPQVIRWQTYEVLPGSGAAQLLTLKGAHPSARVVEDPAQIAAAQQRLLPFER